MAGRPIPKVPEGLYYLPLRNVPGDVMLGLEALARAEGRSVEAEARKLLQETVRRRAAHLPSYPDPR